MKNIKQSGLQAVCSQNVHYQVFSSHLANFEILLQSCARWQIWGAYPTCTNIGFSISALSRKDRTWRKGTTKFSCSHLDVDILQCLASCCAEKPPVLMGGSVPRYEARKSGWCIGRSKNPYSNQERGPTFRVIAEAQFLCFAGLYTGAARRERRSATWPGGRKFFIFFLVLQSRKRVAEVAEPHPCI